MRVLIACEFSGILRDAFIERGYDATSCDLLETERPGPHMKCDVISVLDAGWDLMVAHPPCTYLAASGLHWNKRRPERAELTELAVSFVKQLLAAPIRHIAIENPIGCLSKRIRKPDDITQPWYFGDDASKATCWWLKNLPVLTRTHVLPGDRLTRRANQTPGGQNKLGPSAERWKLRSATYPGLAAAIAEQWGRHVAEEARGCELLGTRVGARR